MGFLLEIQGHARTTNPPPSAPALDGVLYQNETAPGRVVTTPSGTQSREPDDQIRRCSRAWAWSIEKPFSTRQPAAAARAISGVTAGT